VRAEPAAGQRARLPDGTAADHQQPVGLADLPAHGGVVADRQRLDESAVPLGQVIRQDDHVAGRRDHQLGEGGLHRRVDADDPAARAQPRVTGGAVGTRPAADDGVDGGDPPHVRCGADRHAGADRDDPADGFVAHDLAGMAAAVRAGVAVQIRTADAGRGDPQQNLAGPRLGVGPLLDDQVGRAAKDECAHGSTALPWCGT
jgi:hypothetical protein